VIRYNFAVYLITEMRSWPQLNGMLTSYPKLFGALLCSLPLVDMRRYTKLSAGRSWIAEYGDPENPEDWEFLQRISAYHTATADGPASPTLTNEPLHPRKS
jgi:prolyl oligopeptidase PreP (S9A serine peptidase family)